MKGVKGVNEGRKKEERRKGRKRRKEGSEVTKEGKG